MARCLFHQLAPPFRGKVDSAEKSVHSRESTLEQIGRVNKSSRESTLEQILGLEPVGKTNLAFQPKGRPPTEASCREARALVQEGWNSSGLKIHFQC